MAGVPAEPTADGTGDDGGGGDVAGAGALDVTVDTETWADPDIDVVGSVALAAPTADDGVADPAGSSVLLQPAVRIRAVAASATTLLRTARATVIPVRPAPLGFTMAPFRFRARRTFPGYGSMDRAPSGMQRP